MSKRDLGSGRMANQEVRNPIDVHVGARIRLRRTLLGLKQIQLAEALGLSFQQVQKYENGTHRVSASRMFDLVRLLEVPVAYFFEEMGEGVLVRSPERFAGEMPRKGLIETLSEEERSETIEAMGVDSGIHDPGLGRQLGSLKRAVAQSKKKSN